MIKDLVSVHKGHAAAILVAILVSIHLTKSLLKLEQEIDKSTFIIWHHVRE